ncbi:MAG: hypothetical protein V4554_04375 [Pseudomonadota bacterium]
MANEKEIKSGIVTHKHYINIGYWMAPVTCFTASILNSSGYPLAAHDASFFASSLRLKGVYYSRGDSN